VPGLMDTVPPKPTSPRSGGRIPLSPRAAVQLAILFGLCAGYLDLFLMLFRKLWWVDGWILRIGRDFPWTVPAAHAALLLIPGLMIAVACRLRPGLISFRAGAWLLATLAVWAALSRFPLYAAGAGLLAAGLGIGTAAALLATVIPAWRAARVDPVIALRIE